MYKINTAQLQEPGSCNNEYIKQVQAAATAESQNLQSLPLSTLSVDDSRPPQVTYEPQQPIATSTPRATSTELPEISTEAYPQILPGMSA